MATCGKNLAEDESTDLNKCALLQFLYCFFLDKNEKEFRHSDQDILISSKLSNTTEDSHLGKHPISFAGDRQHSNSGHGMKLA